MLVLILSGAKIYDSDRFPPDQVYILAQTHELASQTEIDKGNKEKIIKYYSIAGKYYAEAAKEFEEGPPKSYRRESNRPNNNMFFMAVAGSILNIAQSYQSQMEANQLSQLTALRHASSEGTGLTGYYRALDANKLSYSSPSTYSTPSSYSGVTSYKDAKKVYKELSIESHKRSKVCYQMANCFKTNLIQSNLTKCLENIKNGDQTLR